MDHRMSVGQALIYFILFLSPSYAFIAGIDGPLTHQEALEDGNTTLYCDTTAGIVDDELMLLVWYKGDESIYSYDARSNTEWSSQTFNVSARSSIDLRKRPTPLFISALRAEDQALYHCRVEFLLSPTRYTGVNLAIAVLPSIPFFLDELGNKVENKVGPYFEGDTLVLNCLVIGGRPPPQISWFSGEILVDASGGDSDIPNVRQNELYLPLTRDNTENLSCKASNTKLSPPISSYVDIEIYITADKVSIQWIPGSSLQAGKTVTVQCTAYDVYPSPDISWWLNHKHLTQYSNQTWDHVTRTAVSYLQLTPTVADNGAVLACLATNPAIPSDKNSKADIITMNVTYVPIVEVITHGISNLNAAIENDTVHLTCEVKANPPVERFIWYFNDTVINDNVYWSDEVFANSLIVKKVKRAHAGRYSCAVRNSMGEAKAEHIDINVFYPPECSDNGVTFANDTLFCHVVAAPYPKSYAWYIQTDLQIQNTTSESSSISLTEITVSMTKMINITCKAENGISTQRKPCTNVFSFKHLRPESPRQCDLGYENRQFQIRCIPVENATHYEVTVNRMSTVNTSLILNHRSLLGYGIGQALMANDDDRRIGGHIGTLEQGDEAGVTACNRYGCSDVLLLRPTEKLLNAAKIHWWDLFLDKDVGISICGVLLVVVFVISTMLVWCVARRSRVKQTAPIIQVLQIDDVTRDFLNSTRDLKSRSSCSLRSRSGDYLNGTEELCLTNWSHDRVLHDVDPPPDVTLTIHRESAV